MQCHVEIDRLPELDLQALRQRWTELYGIPPLPRISRQLLIRAIAYQLQVNEAGGLSPHTLKKLKALGKEIAKTGKAGSLSKHGIRAGTKLIREWKGKTHEVEVLEEGFSWAGEHYRSLSVIARLITGTRWSGPRFFGLEQQND